jgi:hypothetical protein
MLSELRFGIHAHVARGAVELAGRRSVNTEILFLDETFFFDLFRSRKRFRHFYLASVDFTLKVSVELRLRGRVDATDVAEERTRS